MANAIPDEFVPLYIHYRRDRAIRAAGNDGELLYLRAIAFARANRTGGVIEDFDLDELGTGIPDATNTAATLVRVGLWVASGTTGWLIRSWGKWNPANASESGTFGNHKRWHLDRGLVAPNCPHCPQEPSESSPPNRPESPPNRPDDRPESPPIIGAISGGIAEREGEEREKREEGEGEERAASQAKRAHKLPADWMPKPETVDAIRAELPNVDLSAEHRKFADHFTANGKPMKDWDAAWRNWMRRAPQYAPRGGRQDERQAMFDRWEARTSATIEGSIA